MIKLTDSGVFLAQDGYVVRDGSVSAKAEGIKRTMAYQILKAHNTSDDMEHLKLVFDALVSPDNNYVNILQTARAANLSRFPVPYVLSNCHNTLCAVGGTMNEDDHVFGLGNAKKYGGIYLPKYSAVLHQYMRECLAGAGKMILGSDSHTRYGALGTLAIGEGGGEVVKQLLSKTYDLKRPPVVAVKLSGTPKPGVGPMDVALTLTAATFRNGFVKNKILEFVGQGIANISVEYRLGIDVMTTESGALSSIWQTDEKVRDYLELHERAVDYQELKPLDLAYYDGLIELDLSQIECMIALPFHPSNAVPIREFNENMTEILAEIGREGTKIKGDQQKPFDLMDHIRNGGFYPDQALVSGCSGGLFENIAAVADILGDEGIRAGGIDLGINPASLPIMTELMNQGIASKLAAAGAVIRPAICGPCFGTTDAPANNQVSIRHVTRNYPNREGSKPGQGQMAAVCLMDARSIAATVRNGGKLTAASDLDISYVKRDYYYNPDIYKNQVFDHFNKEMPQHQLVMGPNIADWPQFYPLPEHLLLKVAGAYEGSITTDALIPSGEATAYRSNPEKISEFTLINYDPGYVDRAKSVRTAEQARRNGEDLSFDEQLVQLIKKICQQEHCSQEQIAFGSLISSDQIGDGSSREQAASCQRVLGGAANLANEYATKRYRSNLINWGILPFLTEQEIQLQAGDYLLVRNIRTIIEQKTEQVVLEVLTKEPQKIICTLGQLTQDERAILLSGSIINYYQAN